MDHTLHPTDYHLHQMCLRLNIVQSIQPIHAKAGSSKKRSRFFVLCFLRFRSCEFVEKSKKMHRSVLSNRCKESTTKCGQLIITHQMKYHNAKTYVCQKDHP